MVSFQSSIKKKTTILFEVSAIAFFKNTFLHINAYISYISRTTVRLGFEVRSSRIGFVRVIFLKILFLFSERGKETMPSLSKFVVLMECKYCYRMEVWINFVVNVDSICISTKEFRISLHEVLLAPGMLLFLHGM